MTSKRCAFCNGRAVFAYFPDEAVTALPFCYWHLTLFWLGLKSSEYHD